MSAPECLDRVELCESLLTWVSVCVLLEDTLCDGSSAVSSNVFVNITQTGLVFLMMSSLIPTHSIISLTETLSL